MFSFLRSKKDDSANTSPSNSTPKKDIESSPIGLNPIKPTDPPKDTWVYIWNMTANKVGHAAIQVGGSQPKMKEEDPGDYASIHPNGIPSTGLTSVIPLPAHVATNLSEDMETLGASENNAAIDMDTPFKVKPILDAKPLPPDHVYHFTNLNNPKMSQHLQQTQEKVKNGDVGYQLFPNVNLVGFFKDSSSFVSQDPIDVELHRRSRQSKESQVYNCTTLVSDVLKEGGLTIKRSGAKPWGITPNGLSDELSNSDELNSQSPKF
ncbi:Uncharacterised protein [Legionella steigerwaltii]|uniref:Uncharacterized protein n=1 Tax=Legionella steigerwaltii TaxID=460 RepID=A0A378L9Q9_9GAMM|nr:hypothetical protein [Legionella steigerwaltii]KTD77750.1 hypothetical protein Lstg_2107 [Legionella steigerwaltii]STY23060.1 Uncharacterised protein [Legionella steigerwaltii]